MDRARLQYPLFQAFDDDGDPLSGGLLYTYIAGTTTNKATYSDKSLATANANPVVLDSRGEADIYFSGTIKLVLKDSADVTIWTKDDVATQSEPHWATSLIGGAAGSVDSIDGDILGDGDICIAVESGITYVYYLDDDLSGVESSPDIINPDDNAGTKSWVLAGMHSATLQAENGTSIDEFSTDGTLAGDSDDAVPTEKAVKTYADSTAQTMTNKTLTSPVINTGVSGTAVLDEDAMGTDSATQLATQQSIKAYADNRGPVDRGDPAAADFSEADFTYNAWTDMDLSSVVPAGATAVLLSVRIQDGSTDEIIYFRKNGNTNNTNRSSLRTQEANIVRESDLVVFCDANRVIEYYLEATDPVTSIYVTVKGWWL